MRSKTPKQALDTVWRLQLFLGSKADQLPVTPLQYSFSIQSWSIWPRKWVEQLFTAISSNFKNKIRRYTIPEMTAKIEIFSLLTSLVREWNGFSNYFNMRHTDYTDLTEIIVPEQSIHLGQLQGQSQSQRPVKGWPYVRHTWDGQGGHLFPGIITHRAPFKLSNALA